MRVETLCPVTRATGGVGVSGRSWGERAPARTSGPVPGRPPSEHVTTDLDTEARGLGVPRGRRQPGHSCPPSGPLSRLLSEASLEDSWGMETRILTWAHAEAPWDLGTAWPVSVLQQVIDAQP